MKIFVRGALVIANRSFLTRDIRHSGLLEVNVVQEHCFVRTRQHRPDSKTNIDSEMNIFGQTAGPKGSGRVREMYRNNIDNNNLSIVYFN